MAPGTPSEAAHTTVDEALAALFTLGTRALSARRCSLYLRASGSFGDNTTNSAHAALHLRCGTGLPATDDVSTIATEGTVAGLVMRARVPLLVPDVSAYPALPTHPDRYATPSFIAVPVLVENDAYGVFNVADPRDERSFSEDDLQSAELVARALSTVLHSDVMMQRALDQGEVDPVTGLYNRRHLQRRLTEESLRARRAGAPLTLLLLTVDCYDNVAARLGVQTAGVLMRCVGEMAAHAVRQSDILAVDDDGEMAIVLPATSMDQAQRVARTLLREIRHDKLPAQLRYDCERLEPRMGLAGLEIVADGHDLLDGAREALRRAREQGDSIAVARGAKKAARSRGASSQQAVATAREHDVPYLADPATAATDAARRLLSAEVARGYACFPVAFESGVLTLAMVNPADTAAIHAVSQLTGLAVYPVAAPRAKLMQAISTLQSAQEMSLNR